MVRKFSLSGNAWNKKLSAKRKVTFGMKSVSEIIEDKGKFVEGVSRWMGRVRMGEGDSVGE